MISKELLSKVLDNEVPYQVKVHKIIIKNNSLNYFYNSKDSGGGLFEANEYINIYELAHENLKEWAKSKGFFILSGYDNTETPEAIINHIYSESGCCCDESFEAETEHQAIFKACQWILDKDSK